MPAIALVVPNGLVAPKAEPARLGVALVGIDPARLAGL